MFLHKVLHEVFTLDFSWGFLHKIFAWGSTWVLLHQVLHEVLHEFYIRFYMWFYVHIWVRRVQNQLKKLLQYTTSGRHQSTLWTTYASSMGLCLVMTSKCLIMTRNFYSLVIGTYTIWNHWPKCKQFTTNKVLMPIKKFMCTKLCGCELDM